jgi:hypothetical protein
LRGVRRDIGTGTRRASLGRGVRHSARTILLEAGRAVIASSGLDDQSEGWCRLCGTCAASTAGVPGRPDN